MPRGKAFRESPVVNWSLATRRAEWAILTQTHHFFFTSMLSVPLFPPDGEVWAVIVTSPSRFPVTRPLVDTVARSVFELDQ